MKYLKTYESLTDMMKPKSDEDILKSLEGMNDSDKIKAIIGNKLSYDLLPIKLDSNGVPDNLTVNGYLDCKDNELTKLPDNLTVNGRLSCSYNQLTELPDDLKVKGDLNCSYNQLSFLPDDLKVYGDLFCYNNPLPKDTKKPKGVKGEMYI